MPYKNALVKIFLLAFCIMPSLKLSATQPTVAPIGGGGSRIAFASYRSGNPQIYTIDLSGKNLTRLTNDTAKDTNPAWSPDGKQIAFVSNRDGNPEIYLMNADGTNQHRLTNSAPAFSMEPSWSPDGKYVAFASNRDDSNNPQIYTMTIDGTSLQRITQPPSYNDNPVWSPDNKHIAFVSTRDSLLDIYVMNTDGTNVSRITHQRLYKFAVENESPSWSSDGHYIIYDSFRSYSWEVYVTDIGGRTIRCVTCSQGTGGIAPIFSPDDKYIALTYGRGTGSIYLLTANGAEVRRLINDDKILSWTLSWEPASRN